MLDAFYFPTYCSVRAANFFVVNCGDVVLGRMRILAWCYGMLSSVMARI
jgi:hypothetical protein